MKLVFVTQSVDPEHPVLAATADKVAALAERVDEIVLLADSAVESALPENCRVRAFRAGSRVGRGARFEAALGRELGGLRGGAVVAHMCPIYAVLAAPLVRPLGIPVVLWFAHWRDSTLLRTAERLSSAIVSVDRQSFPFPSAKLTAIGHGIDLTRFECAPRQPDGTLRVVALGRYSPSKGLDVVVRAAAEAGVRLTVVGPALTQEERAHRLDLERLVDELGASEHIRLEDAVPRRDVPALLGHADVLVDNMRSGAPDKVVYEAAASCLPVLASSPVFDDVLDPELRFDRDSPRELATLLHEFARTDATAREAIGRRMRRRVEERHGVESWADGVLRAARLT